MFSQFIHTDAPEAYLAKIGITGHRYDQDQVAGKDQIVHNIAMKKRRF